MCVCNAYGRQHDRCCFMYLPALVHVVYPRSTPIAHGSAGSSLLVINYCSPNPS